MIQSQELLSALVFVGVSLALFIGVAGVRRLPWRHAATMGVGLGIVFAAFWFALYEGDMPSLILVGAFGGLLIQRGFDLGERERIRISEDIVTGRSSPTV
jgi:hypothetical protein